MHCLLHSISKMSQNATQKPHMIKEASQKTRKSSRLAFELLIAAFGAAKDGDVEELRLLFSPSKMITKDEIEFMIAGRDREGNTLVLKCIHGAAQANRPFQYFECINFLISLGVSADKKDNYGRTATHWCVLYGRLDLLDLLLRAGADLSVFDENGLSCLHLAIGIRSEKLRDDFVEYLCRIAPMELLEAHDSQRRSPLFLALTIGAVRVFEFLLMAKVNPNGVAPDGRQMIIHTVEKGLGRLTEILLKHGASLSTGDPEGFTAIHLAACQENPENIFVLTECVNKTLLNVKDRLGRTPLMYSCLTGSDKNVQILLRQKIWILDKDNQGKTALHHTINNTHCGCADLLCKENQKIVNVPDNVGRTAAHDAVIAGNDVILKLLLLHKCDINFKDGGGHTLAHWATAYGTLNCMHSLIENKALLDEADNHGATPLHYGCQKDDKEELSSARVEVMQILLKNDARLSTADNEGRRPIHWATSSGHISALKLLLLSGDDVNSTTLEDNMTALHLASFQGRDEMVSFLVNQDNVKIDLRDRLDGTPLFYACTSGHSVIAEMLLKLGANPDSKGENGDSPSHCSASIGSVACLELLLDAGANLSSENACKDTPMHEASSAGKTDAVRFLLTNGCNSTVHNNVGATPLHYSVAEGHVDVTKLLLEHKARVNSLVVTKENDYVTPLDIALGNSDLASIQLLQKYGARTGHSMAENSAIIIQNRWKVYKRSYSGVESSFKSYPSDSISTHDKNETTTASLLQQQQQNEEPSHCSDSDNDDHDLQNQQSEVSDSSCCEDDLDENVRNNQKSLFELTEAEEAAIMNEIAANDAECERTDRLMERLQKLEFKVGLVVKETNEISSSKEFQVIKDLCDKMRRRERKVKPMVALPELPTPNRNILPDT